MLTTMGRRDRRDRRDRRRLTGEGGSRTRTGRRGCILCIRTRSGWRPFRCRRLLCRPRLSWVRRGRWGMGLGVWGIRIIRGAWGVDIRDPPASTEATTAVRTTWDLAATTTAARTTWDPVATTTTDAGTVAATSMTRCTIAPTTSSGWRKRCTVDATTKKPAATAAAPRTSSGTSGTDAMGGPNGMNDTSGTGVTNDAVGTTTGTTPTRPPRAAPTAVSPRPSATISAAAQAGERGTTAGGRREAVVAASTGRQPTRAPAARRRSALSDDGSEKRADWRKAAGGPESTPTALRARTTWIHSRRSGRRT